MQKILNFPKVVAFIHDLCSYIPSLMPIASTHHEKTTTKKKTKQKNKSKAHPKSLTPLSESMVKYIKKLV